jgi:hypothetical protein
MIFGQYVFGGSGKIDETDIPMPKKQYKLPENLVGDFILINSWAEREIRIFPNNKFISWQYTHDVFPPTSDYYGYVVKKKKSWYFMPVNNAQKTYRGHPFLSDSTEITLLDTGFSFHERSSNKLNIAIPKIDITKTNIAEDVSISRRTVKQQYYVIDQSNTRQRIDFQEIIYIEDYPPISHDLEISNGIVTIARNPIYNDGRVSRETDGLWRGFVEKNGIIRFTNGVPYYYVKDGTAILEIKGNDVIITIQCSDEEEKSIRAKYPNAQSPIFLVLEY